MENVATKVEGNMLWIGVDLTQDFGPTKGGKGVNVAKSGGYRNVPDAKQYGFNLHVYKRGEKEATA